MREEMSPEGDIEARVREWLSELPAPPVAPFEDGRQPPDLLSFYEALCALRTDFRTNARRTHDTFGRFTEELEHLRAFLERLAAGMEQRETGRAGRAGDADGKSWRALAELHDRLARLEEHLGERDAAPVPVPSWGRRVGQAFAWVFRRRPLTGLPEGDPPAEAVRLVRLHAEGLLAAEGIHPLEPEGRRFDPAAMRAVGARAHPGVPADTVLSVVSRGYRTGAGEVVRCADVIICKGENKA